MVVGLEWAAIRADHSRNRRCRMRLGVLVDGTDARIQKVQARPEQQQKSNNTRQHGGAHPNHGTKLYHFARRSNFLSELRRNQANR